MLIARTPDEAHVYMDLHPCTCGEAEFERKSSLVASGDDLVRVYRGRCRGCNAPREFRFLLPDTPLAGTGDPSFGDARPSQLLDPGEWMLVADHYARRVPPTRRDLGLAVAAMFEILKFMPEGAEDVPADTFTSVRGREVRDTDPGRFRRPRIEAVLATYHQLLASHRG